MLLPPMQVLLLFGIGSVALTIIARHTTARRRVICLLSLSVLVLCSMILSWQMVRSGVEPLLSWGAAVSIVLAALLTGIMDRWGRKGVGVLIAGSVIATGVVLSFADRAQSACADAAQWTLTCGPQILILIGVPLLLAAIAVMWLRSRGAKLSEQFAVAAFVTYSVLPFAIVSSMT